MGILSWLSKPSPPDYETLLSRLSSEIQDAKVHLSEIRLRERRSALLVNAYGIALWAVWAGLWWVRGLPWGLVGLNSHDNEARAIGAAGVAAGPIFIYLLNRALHFYFSRQRIHEETHLRKLLTEQHSHLEAIKKATNYDSTRKLIERYDDPAGGAGPQMAGRPSPARGSAPSTPVRGNSSPVTPSPAGRGPAAGTPRAPGHLAGIAGTPQVMHASPGPIPPDQAAALHLQMQAFQPVLPTPEKKWYDRVVDSILGDDPSQAAQSKYALVCGECFRHNGLVGGKYEWERMQWICPRCNHLNPPPISRMTEQQQQNPSAGPAPSKVSPPTPTVVTRSAAANASPKPRRALGERGTPRSSKLSKEVFSANQGKGSEEEEDDEETGEEMEVDDER